MVSEPNGDPDSHFEPGSGGRQRSGANVGTPDARAESSGAAGTRMTRQA